MALVFKRCPANLKAATPPEGRKISLSGHFGEAYGLLAGFFLDRETGTAIYYAMTGQGSEDAQNAGEYSGMYKWEEMFCTALLDNLFPDL